MAYLCPRCAADPQPAHFASPRRCAFLEDGSFTPDNWSCATLGALLRITDMKEAYGDDESMQSIPVRVADEDDSGFLVLNRYKQRGCTSSAVHVGDFWPPKPVTLALVDAVIAAYEAMMVRFADGFAH
jgi:hypothetical protein